MSTSVNPCYAVIWLDKDQRTNTYCIREKGHPGEHSPNKEELNPICACSHLKSEHSKNGCVAYTLGCKCAKTYEVIVTPTRYREL